MILSLTMHGSGKLEQSRLLQACCGVDEAPENAEKAVDLVEISGNWYLNDLPPMMFIKAVAQQPRLRQPA